MWTVPDQSVDFTVLAPFYESSSFIVFCLLLASFLFWMFHRLRIRYVSASIRLQERVRAGERVRIARDLHDTLLQGVQGLILKFSIAVAGLPDDGVSRGAMLSALDSADSSSPRGETG